MLHGSDTRTIMVRMFSEQVYMYTLAEDAQFRLFYNAGIKFDN